MWFNSTCTLCAAQKGSEMQLTPVSWKELFGSYAAVILLEALLQLISSLLASICCMGALSYLIIRHHHTDGRLVLFTFYVLLLTLWMLSVWYDAFSEYATIPEHFEVFYLSLIGLKLLLDLDKWFLPLMYRVINVTAGSPSAADSSSSSSAATIASFLAKEESRHMKDNT